ncbi:Ena/VASP-like protein isoform 2 [Schistosoma japonicum]|uniref:Ena/VASP-like protein isoform 2 n=1 Tax=Schistosoma japonicum TaxID=6182 RepID=A0A4Z2DP37_SCHJA|nr:Protein enabled like [Schistosoma japonicum]TNN18295.1 Ena/VASP-like protein isoform 2 [Schistosoma japonicum]
MAECAVATAKANVMLYDSKASTWIPSGPGHGISKVQLYHNTITNAYRVVGWRLQDREVVINCAIARGLKYHQARPTFHQWRDSRQQVYGLNFASIEEADAFAAAVKSALESLAALHRQQALQTQQQQCGPPVTSSQFNPISTTVTGVTTTINGNQEYMQQNQRQQPLSNQETTNYMNNNNIQVYPIQPSAASVQNHLISSSENDLSESTEGNGQQNKLLSLSSSKQQSERVFSGDYDESIVNSVNNIVLNDNQNVYPGITTTCRINTSSHQNTETSCLKSTEQNAFITNSSLINGNTEHRVNCDSPYYSSSDDSLRNLRNGSNEAHVNSTTSVMLNAPSFTTNTGTSINNSELNVSSQPSVPAPPPPPPPLLPPPLMINMPGSKAWRQTSTTTSCSKPNSSQLVADNSDTSDYDGVAEPGSLDAQLRLARQQRIRAASVAGLGTSDSSSSVCGPRMHGVDMMSDLQRVLAARRRAKEAEEDSNTTSVFSSTSNTSTTTTVINNSNSNGATSPVRSHSVTVNTFQSQNSSTTSSSIVAGYATLRKVSSPAFDSTTMNCSSNSCITASSNCESTTVSRADLEAFKRELIAEFRREVQQLKNDVIEGSLNLTFSLKIVFAKLVKTVYY